MRVFFTILFCFFTFLLSAQEESPREVLVNDGDTTYIMKKYIMCFLNRGPNMFHSKKDAEEIQEGHLNHMAGLVADGYVVLAGPFGDDFEIRGILIFDVATIEEARELESNDPAVKEGRLSPEYHPWWTAKGAVLK